MKKVRVGVGVGMRGEDDDDYRKGLWTVEEDRLLSDYIQLHGKGKWSKIPLATGKIQPHT